MEDICGPLLPQHLTHDTDGTERPTATSPITEERREEGGERREERREEREEEGEGREKVLKLPVGPSCYTVPKVILN